MFTKQHYEALAESLRLARETTGTGWDGAGVDVAEREIVAMLAADSTSFDAARFARASGIPT